MQWSGRQANMPPLWGCLDTQHLVPCCGVMVLADCFQALFACRIIYWSSTSVVFPKTATTNLSNCTYDLEGFPSTRNGIFVDSELFSYTGHTTPLLQLSDHSSTCEVIQVICSSHISWKNSLALVLNAFNCILILPFIVVLNYMYWLHMFCICSSRLWCFVPDICIHTTFLPGFVD